MSKLGKMKTGRNKPCPCGSGKKFKVCCRAEAPTTHQQFAAMWEAIRTQREAEQKNSPEFRRRTLERKRQAAVLGALLSLPSVNVK